MSKNVAMNLSVDDTNCNNSIVTNTAKIRGL